MSQIKKIKDQIAELLFWMSDSRAIALKKLIREERAPRIVALQAELAKLQAEMTDPDFITALVGSIGCSMSPVLYKDIRARTSKELWSSKRIKKALAAAVKASTLKQDFYVSPRTGKRIESWEIILKF